jgi:hypothetical protein
VLRARPESDWLGLLALVSAAVWLAVTRRRRARYLKASSPLENVTYKVRIGGSPPARPHFRDVIWSASVLMTRLALCVTGSSVRPGKRRYWRRRDVDSDEAETARTR